MGSVNTHEEMSDDDTMFSALEYLNEEKSGEYSETDGQDGHVSTEMDTDEISDDSSFKQCFVQAVEEDACTNNDDSISSVNHVGVSSSSADTGAVRVTAETGGQNSPGPINMSKTDRETSSAVSTGVLSGNLLSIQQPQPQKSTSIESKNKNLKTHVKTGGTDTMKLESFKGQFHSGDISFTEMSEAVASMKGPQCCCWDLCINSVWKYSRRCPLSEQDEFIQFLIDEEFLGIVPKFLSSLEMDSPVKFLNFPEKFQTHWPLMKKLLICVWVVSDRSDSFCKYILHSDFLKFILADLDSLSKYEFMQHDWMIFYLKSLLGILHNTSRHVSDSKWTLREAGLLDKLHAFLSCDIPMVRVKSLIILSYIISDTENETINANDNNISFILDVLRDAMKSQEHMSQKYGMSVQEVLKGLNNLAMNDENKLRIVHKGALMLYDELLQSGNIEEKKLTIASLWSLTFHHYNKRKMREMSGIMNALRDLQRSNDEGLCHAARGTYWELENVSKPSIGRDTSSSESIDDPTIPHIMISYQWDCQSTVMKVKDRLRHAGYKVWMDVEHMTGSTLEAMALAVEKAAVVLICMSQKYKDSPNCRTEAEYVFRLRKDFIPLRLQRQYVPDGWLGIMVGTRLYFDIYSPDRIDPQMPLLIRELRGRGKLSPSYDTPDKVLMEPKRSISREVAPMVTFGDSDVISWRPQHVSDWLTSVGVQEVQEKLSDIDGNLLLEMKKIQKIAPEFFYSMLKTDFGMTALELLKFSRALRSLR